MFKSLKNLFDEDIRRIKSYNPIVRKINDFESEISKLDDNELSQKTIYFKELLKTGKTLDDILPEAFAVVRDAIR